MIISSTVFIIIIVCIWVQLKAILDLVEMIPCSVSDIALPGPNKSSDHYMQKLTHMVLMVSDC